MKSFSFLLIFLFLLRAALAQNPIDDAQLYGTGNQVTAGATLTAVSGSTVNLAAATVTFADAQIPQAKVNGLQAALDGKQAADATLTALAGVTTAADTLIYATGADAFAATALTSFARTLLDDTSAATMRTTLGLAIGTNVQAYDADLGQIAEFSGTGFAVRTASNAWAQRTLTSTGLAVTTNGNGVSGNPVVDVPAASSAEIIAGVLTTKAVTPAGNATALRAYVDPVSNARGPRQGIRINTGSYATVPGYAFLAQDFSVEIDVTLNSAVSGDIYNGPGVGGFSLVHGYFSINTGKLFVCAFGEAVGLVSNTVLPVGVPLHIVYTRVAGVGTFYLNGVADGTGADTTNYGPITQLTGGFNSHNTISRFTIYNYGKTADQVARLFSTGAVDPVDLVAGGVRQLLTGDNSTFTGGLGSWINYVVAVSNVGGKMRITFDGQFGGAACGLSQPVRKGQRYRLRGVMSNVSLSSGGSLTAGMDSSVGIGTQFPAANGPFESIITVQVDVPYLPLILYQGGGMVGTVDFDDLTLEPMAAVVATDPQWDGQGGYWPSIDGRGNHAGLGAGVQSLMRKVRGEVDENFYAPGPAILEVQLTAGQAVTNGDVLAEINASDLFGANTRAHGLWEVGNEYGSRFYIGGGVTIGGTANLTLSEIGGGGGYLALDAGMPCKAAVIADGSDIKIQILAAYSGTVGVTKKVGLYHLTGGLTRNLVK